MGFLLKSLLILSLVAIAGGFLVNHVPSWKERVIEVINPAAKEGRLLGELKTNLDELENSLNSSGVQNSDKNKELVSKSKKLADEVAAVNQKNSGIIKQQISKIVDALTDRTPYPADHLKTTVSELPSPVCPPAK